MASSGWQGDVTLQSGGFGYDYFKGNLRIDSITHSGDTVTVSGAFGVHNAGGYSSYYVYPINAAVNGATGYQQVVAGNQWIATDEWVVSGVSFSFSASAAATSANIEVLWSYNNGTASNSIVYTLYFDASITAPTGLNVTGVSAGQNTVKGNVSVSGWGGGGSASTRYRELQVWAGNMSGDRRYQPVYGDATSGEITCSNSSSGALTITPNTQYWIGGYASNGTMSTGSQPFGTIITKVPNVGGSVAAVTDETIGFNWSIANQGGARDIRIDYKVGSGDWTEATTVSGSGAKSGSYDITGLTPNTAYSVMLRSAGVGGSVSGGTTLSANTLPADPAIELTCTTRDSIVLGYLVEQQGGNETIYLEYKADGSNDWIVGATISTAGSFNGTITISGLTPNTSYVYTVRARSSGGWTSTPETITATTSDVTTKMYCSVNGVAKRVTKVYCSVGGQRKRVKKIYGSVNGQAKLVWEEA